jgi:uncharacterized protein
MNVKGSLYNVFFENGNGWIGYNLVSKKFLEFAPRTYRQVREFLKNPLAIDLDPAVNPRITEKNLIEAGFLVHEDIDEVQGLIKINHRCSTGNQFFLTIALTGDCNFNCIYCFEPQIRGTRLTGKVRKGIIRFIEQKMKQDKSLSIDWYGGEPLLAFDDLLEMEAAVMDIGRKHRWSYQSSISTNGYLLKPAVVDQIVEKTAVKSVRICIDGPPEIHNRYRPLYNGDKTFDVIFQNLDYASRFLKIKLRVNLDRNNWQNFSQLLDILESKPGGRRKPVIVVKRIVPVRISRPYRSTLTLKEFALLEPRLKQEILRRGFPLDPPLDKVGYNCVVASANQFMVDWSGRLYKCTDTFDPGESVGLITGSGEVRIDQARLNQWLDFPAVRDEECRRCKVLPLCMGGCRFCRLFLSHDYCNPERYNLKEYVKLYYLQRKTFID